MTGKIEFSYEEGEAPETVEFCYKDIPVEIAKQITSRLNSARINGRPINLNNITFKGFHLIFGADHGGGAFPCGAKVVLIIEEQDPVDQMTMPPISVPTPKSGGKQQESIVFEVSLAEVECRKDTADLIEKTIGSILKSGFKKIAENKLTICQDETGNIICSFDPLGDAYTSTVSIKPLMFVTGDLAFYAMVLGREG